MTRVSCIDTEVVTSDGARLATEVFVADDGQVHPAVLFRTPYGRSGARGAYDPIGLARLGWAVVIQDVRGRWDSDGEFTPFVHEADDGVHTIAWCRAQPWSNGKVAMAGASYLGFVQWLAAARKPEGLVAIAPTVAAADIRDEGMFCGGVPAAGLYSAWTLGVAAIGCNLDAGLVAESTRELDAWPGILGRPLQDTVVADAMPRGVRLADHDDPLWDCLDASPALPSLDLAGYHLAGWHDIFCEGNLRAYAELAPRGRQRLVVGPWAHSTMLRRTTGEIDFGVAAQGDFNNVMDEQVAFLTEAVAGRDVPTGARLFVMGTNRWYDFAGWPVPTTSTTLYLDGGGSMRWTPSEAVTETRWTHDPASPVPTRGGRTLHPIQPDPGPLDQRSVEARPDVQVFTSPVLERDLTVIGQVRATLSFASTASETDLAVKLVDAHPDGRAMGVVDSIRRLSVTPGKVAEVVLDVGATAMTFGAGHRIRVEVASSNFPRFSTAARAEQTLSHGGRTLSRIELPVVSLEAGLSE